jgi:2-(1,2-epoxy-1,2-dihydrophenyl)acetyl-CoA isomerase
MGYGSIINEAIGDVAVIRLNDEKSLNAMSPQMVDELLDALAEAARSKRAIMLTAVGRTFCSGANLGSLNYTFDDTYDAGVLLESHFNPLMIAIRDLPIPLACAVNGHAVGVGGTVALAGDFIIASKNAYFLQAFRHVGVAPDAGTAYLLTRSVGRVRAMEMMLLGEKIYAEQAFDWGLINRVVAPEEVEGTALDIARALASGPTKALGAIRRSCWHALDTDFAGQLAHDRVVQRELGKAADHQEAIKAFFEKRPAVFTGQ